LSNVKTVTSIINVPIETTAKNNPIVQCCRRFILFPMNLLLFLHIQKIQTLKDL